MSTSPQPDTLRQTILQATCNPLASSLPKEPPDSSLLDISNSSSEGEFVIKS